MKFKKITISIHFGKKDNYPFLENFLKSFLICNTYPNIQIIITETGGDLQIRNWLKKIDFSKNFINFDGVKTNIKRNKNTKPILKLVFHKKIHKGSFWVPYMKSFNDTAYEKDNTNNFFVFFVEDCQFFIKGNLILKIIKSLSKIGVLNNHIGLSIWTSYRYKKFNNRVKKIIKINKNLSLFETAEIKGDIFSVMSRKLLKKTGRIVTQKDGEKYRQQAINDLTKRFIKHNVKRFYPSIAPIVTLDNDYHDFFREKIISETKKNPDYVLLKIISEKEYYKKFNFSVSKLVTAEDIYNINLWGKFLKSRFFIKKIYRKLINV